MVGVSAPESTSPRRHPAAPAATGAPPSHARPAHASGRASNAGRAGMRWAGLRPGLPPRAPAGHRRPQTPAGLEWWPQTPARLVLAGLRPNLPTVTVPVKDWPQTPAGLSGSRFLRHGGGAGPRRGTSSQTAGCGGNWSMAAVCAVCCGGTPTRPHPTVSYAADRRRVDKAVTDDSLLHSDHRRCFRWSQRSVGDGLSLSLPPAGRRRRDGRAGSCRGAPAANCTHGRLEATDPAPCSL